MGTHGRIVYGLKVEDSRASGRVIEGIGLKGTGNGGIGLKHTGHQGAGMRAQNIRAQKGVCLESTWHEVE